MVRLGRHKQVFEAHRRSFLGTDYSAVGASAPAQAAVAKPLTETAFGRPARCFLSAISHAKSLLEFDQQEQRYSPVFSKSKTWAIGKVNDEGSWSLRTQYFHRGEFQVGSFQAITQKAACRSVRVTKAVMKVLRAGRAA
jgi:hypothetical protein